MNENDGTMIFEKIKKAILSRNNELDTNWKQVKSREIINKSTEIVIESTPAEAFAEGAERIGKQLRNQYGKIQRMSELIEVEDLKTTNYESSKVIEVERQLAQTWAYPVPNGSGFTLHIFAKFDIENTIASSGITNTSAGSKIDYVETIGNTSIKMVFVQGGTFQMGSNSEADKEAPIHPVTVKDYYIGKYEVTQKLWRAVMGRDPGFLRFNNCDECPVNSVNWGEVQGFLQKLNEKHGRKYRLPTEAEWEYSARGGNKSMGYTYSGSNIINEIAWYDKNTNHKMQTVGSTEKCNELGIYDMSGNVEEYCQDLYKGYPGSSGVYDDYEGKLHVVRGGSWYYSSAFCTVSIRGAVEYNTWSPFVGFRLVSSQ